MSNLKEIQNRHGWDGWKDAVFIGAAALMTALAIGSVTSRGVGSAPAHEWRVTVIESSVEVGR